MGDLLARARLAADRADLSPATASNERLRLERLASEFESMLLVQMLRDMRRASRWGDEEGSDGLGAESLFETLDVELAAQMAGAQSLGLTTQLLSAFDRARGLDGTALNGSSPEIVDQLGAADPTPRPVVTSPFGWRRDPLTGETRFHRGVDLLASYGQQVATPAAGRVVFSGPQGGYGTTVLIEHVDGTRTRYAHLSATAVREGESVQSGQTVGQVGSTGRATGPHLHVERLDRQGRVMDPMGRGPE
jgi:murein DD-endopeptidase MepM/ murein hydrolase activator NlpD